MILGGRFGGFSEQYPLRLDNLVKYNGEISVRDARRADDNAEKVRPAIRIRRVIRLISNCLVCIKGVVK